MIYGFKLSASRLMRAVPTGAVLIAFGLAPASASEACSEIRKLVQAAPAGFSSVDQPPTFHDVGKPENCSISKELSGSSAYICFWEFDYRSPAATQGFETLNQSLIQCLGSDAQVKSDQPVNHPDFYDLKTYATDTATLSISIKDKAALEKTFVFLRVGG
ncbi:MAG: hypothetical protein AAGA76_01115 [Pseudomonadota bacterium]